MLSTGMRAPMGLKIYGPDLETIEQSGKAIEQALKDVPSVHPLVRLLRPGRRRSLSGDQTEPG